MVKTVTLTAGTPQAVTFSEAYPFYWIDNKTSGEVYASVGGTPEPSKDGTYTIAAGSQLRISGGDFNGGIVLLGEGKVQVVASGIAACPFKSAPVSGGGEGGDADTVNGHTVEADVPADAVFTDTTYDAATKTEDGLMSAADKSKLDGIEEGANKTVVDTALSGTSTNPVQNKVVNSALKNKADKSKYGDTTINVGRKADTAVGNYSTAEGYNTTASGKSSHAEGGNTSENGGTYSDRIVTISDVDYTISGCAAYGINSHAEGTQTFAYGHTSHAEGLQTTASGNYSHAEGRGTTASGNHSHTEGYNTTASRSCSHAEGLQTTASGNHSHTENYWTKASGDYSHAEGSSTTASSICSHAEGYYTTASGSVSHAEGEWTTASNYASHASGKYNAAMTDGGSYNNTTGTAFVIGNGTSSTAKSNAFSVQYSGVVKAKSTITASTTADYAEFFEWLDGNPDDEDRIGYFVTLDGNKIRIAAAADDYILGVVSGEPFVLGNGDCDTWNGMFLRDEFRRTIFEPAPKMAEILDSEGNPTGEYEEVEGEFEGTRPKLNPEYDHTQKYISRFDRKEWAPVGMLGVLAVRHDGTAVVNGYVTVNADGIATACEKSAENAYRVIKSNTDSVVEIIFR